MSISVSSSPKGEFTVVELSGEFDLHTADTLRDEIVAAAEEHGSQLLLDMSAVGFMDSTTLSALLQSEQRAKESGGSLCLVGLQHGPAKVLRVSGLDQHFPIFATADEVVPPGTPPLSR